MEHCIVYKSPIQNPTSHPAEPFKLLIKTENEVPTKAPGLVTVTAKDLFSPNFPLGGRADRASESNPGY
ncbi:hypothetical protein JTE90_009202 [Oedothorax gibbosus]|uniref:Uncharacterized protein n=1 Tax=Oedothorax gibbosus TaxID=931172 RepID=A0AAV6UWU9_9ARAC|nr:hypothetical protein JTE90_009202 [Oedothorax gibbosus]